MSRIAVDFKTPLLEANWFVLGSNCTETVGPTTTGGVPSGTAAYEGRKGPYHRSAFRVRG